MKVEEAPGARERGSAKPEQVKEPPGREAWETFSVAVPVFLIVSDCVLVAPTDTFVKLMLPGTTEICG